MIDSAKEFQSWPTVNFEQVTSDSPPPSQKKILSGLQYVQITYFYFWTN